MAKSRSGVLSFLSTAKDAVFLIITILLLIMAGITVLVVDYYGLLHAIKVLQHD